MKPHGNARVSLEQCAEIRGLVGTQSPHTGRNLSLREIGARYGVSAVAVHKILNTRRWGEQ